MQGPFLRRRGRAATIPFTLYEVDGVDMRVDAAHASGDTKIMKDEGAEGNTSNGFTDEGQGYSIVLDDSEMQAARVLVHVVDSATKVWLDTTLLIETFEPPGLLQATDIASLASQTSFTLAEGSANDNAYKGAMSIITDAITLAQKAVGLISAYAGSTKTVTLAADPGIFDAAAGDYIDIIAVPKQLPGTLIGLTGSALGTTMRGTDGALTTKTGFALTSAYDFAKGSVAMTEGYAAQGAAPTPVEAMFAIMQQAGEFAISGTTLTVKKIDGSATAFTVTLNDATNPTSRTRAT